MVDVIIGTNFLYSQSIIGLSPGIVKGIVEKGINATSSNDPYCKLDLDLFQVLLKNGARQMFGLINYLQFSRELMVRLTDLIQF